jgi:hypothetical protein
MTRAATSTTVAASSSTSATTSKHHVNAVANKNKSNVDVYGFFAWIASTAAAGERYHGNVHVVVLFIVSSLNDSGLVCLGLCA